MSNTKKKVKVIAHRGFSGKFPENTVVAFKEAIKLGVDDIEMDIKITKDGTLVILHDESVDRTTNGTGKIQELTIEQVKDLDAGSWFSPAFKGIKIPTFNEALDSIPDNIELNLHLLPNPVITRNVIITLKERNRINNSYLAIDAGQIQLAREMCKEIRICNMRTQTNPVEYIEETHRLKCPILQFYTPAYEVTKELIDKAHSYGIFVNVFFADTENEMKKLIENGADAILTNRPDILIKILKGK